MKTSFKIELKSTCDLCDRIVQKFLSFDQSLTRRGNHAVDRFIVSSTKSLRISLSCCFPSTIFKISSRENILASEKTRLKLPLIV